jgi:transcriptional regulator with XRE-family HTH domain
VTLRMRLRTLRAEAGLTMEEAAKRAELGRDSLGRIERGQSHPQAATLGRLARVYGVPTETLIAAEEWVVPKVSAAKQEGVRRLSATREQGMVTPERGAVPPRGMRRKKRRR